MDYRLKEPHMFSGASDVSPTKTGCSAPPKSNKDKHVLRAPTTISLQSLAELRSFKRLILGSTKYKDISPDLPATPESPSSSAILIGCNEDMLTQILLFLPPKSLIRFQCVSKRWLSLISSLHFRRLHASHSPTASPSFWANTSGLFLYRNIYGYLELNSFPVRVSDANSMGIITSRLLDFVCVHGEILKVHSCNGLFCLDFHWNHEVRRLCVYNPTTNQYRLVQWPDINEKSCTIFSVNIVFNPLKSDYYKIVCLGSRSNENGEDSEGEEEGNEQLDCFVYSSETLAWKKDSLDIEPLFVDFYFQRGVFLNGNLYWASTLGSLLYFDSERGCIGHLLNDRRDEDYGEILYFGESNGKLHLIEAVKPHSDLLEVLEWEENLKHTGWIVKYSVNLSFLTALNPLMLNGECNPAIVNQLALGILCFHADEKGKTAKLIISAPGKIISYEVNDMTIEELVEIEPAHLEFLGKNLSWYIWEDAHKQIDTLACV